MQQEVEKRISILLSVLEREVANSLLDQLPADQARRIRSHAETYRHDPPKDEQVDQVLAELAKILRLLDVAVPGRSEKGERKSPGTARPKSGTSASSTAGADSASEFQRSDDPLSDLEQLHPLRLAGALADETAQTSAVLLSGMSNEQAGAIARLLPAELRTEVILQMKSAPRLDRRISRKLAEAAIDKALALDLEALEAAREDVDAKLAGLLRTMGRDDRVRVLEALTQQDPDSAARVRECLYHFDDLLAIDDRSLQRVLSEVDMNTLARALKDAGAAIRDRVLDNLSRRARETLGEEMDLLGRLQEDDRRMAESRILQVMLQLDENGELVFQASDSATA